MEWSTHTLTGVALGYVITNDWTCALVSGLTAVIPDLDEPKSKFGKILFCISYPINQIFEHRTFTHSLLFLMLFGLLTSFIGTAISIASMIGIATHILGDMVTGKVQLLYPHKKKMGVQVSKITYLLMDRITRVVALLFLGIVAYQSVLNGL